MSRNDGRSKQFIIPVLLTAIHSLQQCHLLDYLGSFSLEDLKEAVERALEDWLDRPVPVGSSAQKACQQGYNNKASTNNNTNTGGRWAPPPLTMIGPDDIETHAGLLYEAFVRPKASGAGPSLALREESLEMSEEQLLGKLEESLLARLENEEERKGEQREEYREMLERFRADGRSYLSYLSNRNNKKQRKQNKESSIDKEEQLEEQQSALNNIFQSSYSKEEQEQTLHLTVSTTIRDSSTGNNSLNMSLNRDPLADASSDSSPPKSSMTQREAQPSMIAFLAHIRKAGMDMIFPQDLHDKTLLATFMALKCGAPLAHREVMDMVNAAIQSRLFQHDLDSVSKTKVRGVLTLLKNSNAIKTGTGEGGEGIRLFLGDGVSEFADFRDKHDQFVKHLLSQQRIVMGKEVKAEVVWLEDKAGKRKRASKYADMERELEQYYLKGSVPAKPKRSTVLADPATPALVEGGLVNYGIGKNAMFEDLSLLSNRLLPEDPLSRYSRSLLLSESLASQQIFTKSQEPVFDYHDSSRSKSWLPSHKSLDRHHYNYTTPLPQPHPSSASIPLYHSSQPYLQTDNKIPDSSQALFAKALTHIRPRKEKIVNPTSFQPPLPKPFGSAASPQYRYPPPPAGPGISRDFCQQQSFPPEESRDFYRYPEKRDAVGSLGGVGLLGRRLSTDYSFGFNGDIGHLSNDPYRVPDPNDYHHAAFFEPQQFLRGVEPDSSNYYHPASSTSIWKDYSTTQK